MGSTVVLKKTDKIVARDIGGEILLLPLSSTSDTANCIYALNETASAFWGLIDGKKTLAQIMSSVQDVYDVDEKGLRQSVNALVKDLKSIQAVEEV